MNWPNVFLLVAVVGLLLSFVVADQRSSGYLAGVATLAGAASFILGRQS